jgi:nicotinamide-nucleotide amidase
MKQGTAEIICTGSELLEGRLNLYVPLFHDRLAPLGFRVTREQSSGDDLAAIADCISGALRRADLVITCGGLGPTFDDLTRQAAAKALGRKLLHSKACAQILAFNYKLDKLPPNIKDQCLILDGAKVLENANGTAFGQVFVRGRKMLVLLPGPRKEWEPMFRDLLEWEIKSFFRLPALRQIKLHAAGLGEPQAERLLRPAMRRYPAARYTILAGPGLIDFVVSGDDRRGLVARAAACCRRLLGAHLYGEGDATLAAVVGEKLKAHGATAAAAESCTGGLASQMITEVPGSSAYFLGGAVTYSNAAKMQLLGVKAATLRRHGAVSPECAREMAAGARKTFGADYAFSVTGIAGPDGATEEKPVGLVYFGLASKRRVTVFRKQFRHGRAFVRACAANFILDELRKVIK